MKQKYVFKPYSEIFLRLFVQEKMRLLGAIEKECIDIQHVGSTAVPGLGGKGIIDIALAIERQDIEQVSHKLESLGYLFRESGSSPERWFFRIDLPDDQEGVRRYHLHVTFPESIEWKSLLAFRDYLRSHPKAAHKYAELKRKNAEEANEDGALYRKKKSPFFQEILMKALGHKIYFVIGASGSGKTMTLKQLEKAMPKNCILIHFDSIGIPSFKEMEKEHGSIEEWQRVKTIKWVERIAKEELLRSNVIFDAQVRPSFIAEACKLYGVDYEAILFDCSNKERKKRLVSRRHPELADENMMNWALFLRKEFQKHHHKIINNTHLTLEETFQLFMGWLRNQISEKINISIEMVAKLISNQFPEYAELSIKAVEPNGWDNRTFRLGTEMSVRLPSAKSYASKVHIEQKWLLKLAPHLSVPIPKPIAMGKPTKEYSWNWSIYKWIEGQSANTIEIDDHHLEEIAIQLAHFLKELQAIDPTNGPVPGEHNFLRGESPIVYDAEIRSAIDVFHDHIDVDAVVSVWEKAINSRWNKNPVWIHGDISASNILVKDAHLVAVIDFGGMAVGDPSCDLVIAWTFLKGKSREIFRSDLELDVGTWARARGWALWKALITLETLGSISSMEAKRHLYVIDEILKEHVLENQV